MDISAEAGSPDSWFCSISGPGRFRRRAGFLCPFAWQLCGRLNWQADSLLYHLLLFVRDYLLLFLGIAALLGWTGITYWFISRPLRYLDEIVIASEQLAQPDSQPILLPGAMKNVQDELNLVREQALRNALLAKEAEQRKNDLIVYLAHDLKTPLTSVIGYLTLLRRTSWVFRRAAEQIHHHCPGQSRASGGFDQWSFLTLPGSA